jgi:uncharacterized FAD-dependent dehydrogenase
MRRSIDARNKKNIKRIFTVEFSLLDELSLLNSSSPYLSLAPEEKESTIENYHLKQHVLVVGMGPSGLFAAKHLAESGLKVTLIDQGKEIKQRIRDVENFWAEAVFDPKSNVQFGEGGAGTFSDGKLTTRLNHPYRREVLQNFVEFGAPENILFEARPHIGSDRLRCVIVRFRQYLLNLGVEVLFERCLTELVLYKGRVIGATINDKESISCDAIVLATGHSARETYYMLERHRVHLEPKGFAMGARVEHPAELINRIQYGQFAHQLPAAEYALAFNDKQTGRGVYSFCMCPGGEVVNASSEQGGLVINGMSRMARKGCFSNSALVVTVNPSDWGGRPLGGVSLQRKWEQRAFASAPKNFLAPAQNMLEFCEQGTGPVSSSCRPGVFETELRDVLPEFVYHGIKTALPFFESKMKGFMSREAVLIGLESRTSSPLRIVRDALGESISHPGLYPVGEGAGYAGGIMSSAFDGLRVAEYIVKSMLEKTGR